MLEFLRNNRRQPIAMDIGTDGIRLLQMNSSGTVPSVATCARWRFGDIPMQDTQQRRQLAVAAVRDMLKKGRFKGRRVITALGSSKLAIKNVRLPHMTDSELREAVMWEARERFDFPIESDQLAALNAGEVRQGTELRDEIILLAAPREVIDDHLAMLDEMGLRPEHIDAEPVALFRSFERLLRRRNDDQSVSVLVDVGVSGTRVVVAKGREILFIKAIDIGGFKFTESVAAHLNLSYAEASEMRMRVMQENSRRDRKPRPDGAMPRSDGDSLEWTLYDAERAEIEALSHEIALCLRYCSVTFRGLRCQGITLIGGEAYDGAISDLLGQHLSLPCEIGTPMLGMELTAQDMGNRRGLLAEWALCAGLAIRDMDMQHSTKEDDDAERRLSA